MDKNAKMSASFQYHKFTYVFHFISLLEYSINLRKLSKSKKKDMTRTVNSIVTAFSNNICLRVKITVNPDTMVSTAKKARLILPVS